MHLCEIDCLNITELLPQCLALQADLVSDPNNISAEKFIATANAAESFFLGLFEENSLLGMGVISKITHPVNITAYINNMVVHREARGRGYFTIMMDALEAKAKEWGCDELALTCSRKEVQPLYERRGYQQKDTNYYLKK